MASLEPRANGSVRVVWRVPGQPGKQSLTARTAAKADALKAIVEDAGGMLTRDDVVRLIEGDATNGPSVLEWVHSYIDTLVSIEGRTVADYHRQADEYMGTLTMPLPVLERPDVRAWVAKIAKRRAPKTVANVHGLLSAAMTEAVAQRKRADNPCTGTRLPRADDTTEDAEQVFLTAAEFDAIDAGMPGWLSPLIRVDVRTGMRWAEITALRVRQVRLDDSPPTISVTAAWKRQADYSKKLGPPKSKKSRRIIELDAKTVAELRPLVAGKTAGALVFHSVRDEGKPLPSTTFWRHWDRAIIATVRCEDCRQLDDAERKVRRTAGDTTDPDREPCGHAGDKMPRFHDLRHTHVAWLIDAGIDITIISRRLGHEKITTTFDTYGHLLPTSAAKVIAALDGI